MTRYRNALPQLNGNLFLADGGIETTLVFHDGLDLPHFAAFHLLKDQHGTAALRRYFRPYASIARQTGTGLILETATWRASSGWGEKLGYTPEALAVANRRAVELLEEIRDEFETDATPVVISGCVGPRGDGYVATDMMTADAAGEYHLDQVKTFAGTAADMVSAITMNYTAEAIGIARAARKVDMPVAISITVETNGSLPTGQSLRDAIMEVDAATSSYPSYYMINCAHPAHFQHALVDDPALNRIRGLRANASHLSHAELDAATELHAGNPRELGAQYAQIKKRLKNLNIMGGCCGTDHRHIEQIAAACLPLFEEATVIALK